jgi:hypothetical protein
MIALNVNRLLRFAEDGHTERVLWIDPSGRGCFAIDIDASSAAPVFRGNAELSELIERDQIITGVDDARASAAREDEISPLHRQRRDQSWQQIKPLVMQQPEIFRPQERCKAVERLVVELGESRRSLYRLLRRYWQRERWPGRLDHNRAARASSMLPASRSAIPRRR